MSAPWFRVPMWCHSMHDEANAARARAWVYLLGAWHAGDDPSTREVRRVTSFGGTRADTLVETVAAWAVANGAAVPSRLAGQQRGGNGAPSGQPDAASTPASEPSRGSNGAASGQERGAHARVPSQEREMEKVEERETQEAPAPAVAERASRGPDLSGLWGDLVAFTPKPAAWKLTEKRRAHLQQRIASHDVATVERVAEWVRTSSHERARFLRERGDPDTLLRPEKFDTYAAMSAGPAPRALTTPGARNTRGTLASDLFTDDDTPTPRPHAVDAAWSNA